MSPRRIDRRTADALLSGRAIDDEPELSAFVRDLRSVGESPAPSVALYGLLSEGFEPEPDAHVVRAVSWTRSTTWVRGAVALGVATLALTSGAAANALPRPVQNAVADVVEAVTPISVPRPAKPVVPADDRGRSEDVRQDGTGTDDSLQRDAEHEGNGGGGRSGSGDRRGDDAPGEDRSGKGDESGKGSGSGKSDDSGKSSSGKGSSGSSGSGSDDDSSKSGGSGTSGSSSSSDDRPTAAPADDRADDSSGSGKDRPATPEPVRTSGGDDGLSGGSDDHSGSGKTDSADD